jgi:hypothetical protein
MIHVEQAASRIAAVLRDKRVLLIVDDVWDAHDAAWFKVGGHRCATIMTTRVTGVANDLATTRDIYVLKGLEQKASEELLEALAPNVVPDHRQAVSNLARDLGGLPLGLQVAGRFLRMQAAVGADITALIHELRTTALLLRMTPPTQVMNETNATVAAVFDKSTDLLDPYARNCFANLGAFAAQPASFDLGALRSVWRIEDPRPLALVLVESGLLEPMEDGRFQIHELLRHHARFISRRTPSKE